VLYTPKHCVEKKFLNEKNKGKRLAKIVACIACRLVDWWREQARR
jgi:hypothetical protein